DDAGVRPTREAGRDGRAHRGIRAKARGRVERGGWELRVEQVLDVERHVEAAMLVTYMQIELRPAGDRDRAVVRRRTFTDPIEAEASANHARAELVPRRQ